MSKKSASRVPAHLLKSVSLFALVALVSGCAQGTVRFTDGFYTGAVPTQNVGPVDTPFPQTTAQPVYQPQAQPVYQPPQASYSPGVDQTYTASVPAPQPVYRAPQVVRQPMPQVQATAPTPQPIRSARTYVAPTPQPVRAPVPAVRPPAQIAQAPQRVTPVVTPARVDPIVTASTQPQVQPVAAAPVAQQPMPAAPRQPGWSAVGGTTVVMREGETIYNLSKRYGVPANEIMKANNLADARSVTAGKNIIIPTYVYSRSNPVSAPDANSNVRIASSNVGSQTAFPATSAPIPTPRPLTQGVQVASVQPQQPMPAPQPVNTGATGRYQVVSGDTLSGIARRSGSSVAAIKQLNGMTSDTVRLGQTLLIPAGGTVVAAPPPATNPGVDPVITASVPQAKSVQQTPVQNKSIATIDNSSTASAPAQTGVAAMRWPVQGRVVSAFGSNVGGKGNDGIDISVPQGTSVKAAENGVVIYAGDGLKEFGNTVLVRHGDGLVTVYGHLSKIGVARGDTVSRGQTLGASGMTGSAKQPQLHFEVRKNTSPVNPMTYLR